jgi:DNA-binding transcriptional LysR family regulator
VLNPNRLHVFRAVATRGSLAAAARVLALSQSAVSQQIAALEDEVGVTLLERNARGVRLTEAGRFLLPRADRIALELREAELELQALATGDAGVVRIGAFATAAATIITQAIGALRSSSPAIEVDLIEADPKAALPLLTAGELDLALDFDYDVLPDPGARNLARAVICEEPFFVALPGGHRRAPAPGRRRLSAAPDPRAVDAR